MPYGTHRSADDPRSWHNSPTNCQSSQREYGYRLRTGIVGLRDCRIEELLLTLRENRLLT